MRYYKLRLETHNLINHHTPTFLDLGQLLSIACNIDGYSFVAKLFSSLCTACNSIAGEKPGNKAKVAKENTFVSPL